MHQHGEMLHLFCFFYLPVLRTLGISLRIPHIFSLNYQSYELFSVRQGLNNKSCHSDESILQNNNWQLNI